MTRSHSLMESVLRSGDGNWMRERKGEVDLEEEEEVEDEDEPWGQDAVSRVPETVFTTHGRTLRITASMVAVRGMGEEG